jgi:hypothetical protein
MTVQYCQLILAGEGLTSNYLDKDKGKELTSDYLDTDEGEEIDVDVSLEA